MPIPTSTNDPSLIVGIGASAGGLDAFSELLSHLPIDTGMAFVLVQHLSSGQKSLLSELLARTTPMPVITATDGMVVQANQVYVIPPDAQMTIAQGRLHLAAYDQTQGHVKTIDLFLQSLAADQKDKAIAIILSGSNDDGTLGVQRVQAAGGIVFAQDRASAEFCAMPDAAIATGKVDFVLPPAAIAAEVVKLRLHPYLRQATTVEQKPQTPPIQENELEYLFRLLLRQTGVDFSNYKPSTFQRRLGRRLALQNCITLSEYIQYLQNDPGEIEALYQDVLIAVTSFFRDADVYAALQERVIPSLLQRPTAAVSIRIWVPGCSTGEEAYSLAICLLECLQYQAMSPTIQIFGTDISDKAIEVARAGFYPESQMEGVSAERRKRFFNEVGGGYQIKKSVRELCIFARQDLSSDPPFSEIDLLSCRNVLIYFQPPLQRRVLSLLHYSLKPTGFLVLGNSESLGDSADLFEVFDAQAKIYTRRSVPSRFNLDLMVNYTPRLLPLEQPQAFASSPNSSGLQQWADQIVLRRFGPMGVIVNEQLEIVQFRGDTSPFLRIPEGEPSYTLFKMLRPSLVIEVRAAIEETKRQGVSTRRSGLKLQDASGSALTVEVIPFHGAIASQCYYLILFERETPEPTPTGSDQATEAEAQLADLAPEIGRLRQDLASSRQELLDSQTLLQLTVEEKESTNQQLLAANEEILSSNEELKSTNEELQTAKEEIQSANEELKTTNEELQTRNIEVRRANDDLINLINNVNLPILMLSDDLCIRRFTPSAQAMFNLIPTDVGRPISDLRFDIVAPNLEALVVNVITTLNPVEQEVQDQEGHWYVLRVRPYRTSDNQITGAIVALVDIDNLKQTEQSLRQTQAQLETELAAMNQLQDLSLKLFSSPNLDEVLKQVLQVAIDLLQADRGNIQLYNSQRGVLEIVCHQGFNAEFLDAFRAVRVDDGTACSRALQFGQRVIIEDVQTDPAFQPYRAIAAAAGYRAVQSTPLISYQGELLGVLSTHFSQPHRPSERQLRLLDLYGRMVSTVIALVQTEQEKQALAAREQACLSAQVEAAEAANASKDEFLALLSHELRAPLTSVLSWTQLLQRGLLSETEQKQAIATILESALTQTRLIEDLLDVSRIVQQRFEIATQPCDLAQLLQQAIDLFRPQFQEKGLHLEVDLQPCPDLLNLDSMRISQVFSNLLSNGIKFTPPGGQITLQLWDAPHQVRVQISDTGEGIPAELLPHIFARFRQGDSSNTRRAGGLGVGLFLAQSIIQAHGGALTASSPGKGQGATFTITLPKTIAQPRQAPPPPATAEVNLNGIKILLVEDDAMTSLAIAFALERFGATVVTVCSAAEALAQLTQELPDLLISDIGLPDTNGYDLIRQIRALAPDQGGQLPAIALSGYADPQTVAAAEEAGFQTHLSKPVDIDQLVICVSGFPKSP